MSLEVFPYTYILTSIEFSINQHIQYKISPIVKVKIKKIILVHF